MLNFVIIKVFFFLIFLLMRIDIVAIIIIIFTIIIIILYYFYSHTHDMYRRQSIFFSFSIRSPSWFYAVFIY